MNRRANFRRPLAMARISSTAEVYPHACEVYEGKVERYKKTNYDGHCASYDGTIVMKMEKRKNEMEECIECEVEWKNTVNVKFNGRMQ